MINTVVRVVSAVYGDPSIAAVDVTANVQAIFDRLSPDRPHPEIFSFQVSPAALQVLDPHFGVKKTLGVQYTLPDAGGGRILFAAARDDETLSVTALPTPEWLVHEAWYGGRFFGSDIKDRFQAYLDDPRNGAALTVGSDDFFAFFTHGSDPEGGTPKGFFASVTELDSGSVIRVCAYDMQTVSLVDRPVTPNQSWMSTTLASYPHAPLRAICLPSTHDSGTYALRSHLSAEYGPLPQILVNEVKRIVDAVNIPAIGELINPASWVLKRVISTVKDYSITTRRPILAQLRDGIRCLDLRIYADPTQPGSPFVIYHGLMGVNLRDVMTDVATFVTSIASKGEIVYVTIGHYRSDGGPFSNAQIRSLCDEILTIVELTNILQTVDSTSLFDVPYGSIVGSPAASKVILVANLGGANGIADDTVTAEVAPGTYGQYFWSVNDYSPPDNDWAHSSLFSGFYTDTDDPATMRNAQSSQSQGAYSGSKPFALFLTLTPQRGVIIAAIVRAVVRGLQSLALWALAVPFGGAVLAGAIEGVIKIVEAGVSTAVPYASLKALNDRLYVGVTLAALIHTYIGPTYATPTFVYVDRYEDQGMVVEGNEVSQLVETAKALTAANLASMQPVS